MEQLAEVQAPKYDTYSDTPAEVRANEYPKLNEVQTNIRPRPRLHKIAKITLAASLLGGFGAEFIPHDGTQDAAMLAQLGESDLEVELPNIIPDFHASSSCLSAEMRNYSIGDGLYKNQEFGWFASTWSSSRALEDLYVESLDNPSCYHDFVASLSAINSEYWTNKITSYGGYDQGPVAFHDRSDAPLIDDNLWMALIDVQAYAHTKNHAFLKRAEEVFRLAMGQWDKDGGGNYWQIQLQTAVAHGRAAVSNAPLVILGVDLFLITGDNYYLREGKKVFSWVEQNLFDPTEGLYNDHMNKNGALGTAKYTYVQGVVIGALLALNEVDAKDYPLDQAVNLALNSMAYFNANGTYGNPAFDSIWAQNVMALAARENKQWFTDEVKASIRNALAKAPANPSLLEYVAGKAELQALAELPTKQYQHAFLGATITDGLKVH